MRHAGTAQAPGAVNPFHPEGAKVHSIGRHGESARDCGRVKRGRGQPMNPQKFTPGLESPRALAARIHEGPGRTQAAGLRYHRRA